MSWTISGWARRAGTVAVGAAALAVSAGGLSQAANAAPQVGSHTLRVCADPNYLPYSNKAGEGF